LSSGRELAGWRILVPRGGRWGDWVAGRLRARGATPVVAPLIDFAGPPDPDALTSALRELEAGAYDWVVVSSATTVDVLLGQQIALPATTRIAAVGETTASALSLAGYRVDFSPESDNSARGLVRAWPVADGPGTALVLHAETPDPTLMAGLAQLHLEAHPVMAYRTVGVPVRPEVAADVASGRIGAVLVSSGSVARQLAEQLAPLPETTVVACIGPRTAFDTRAAGIAVHVIAEERSVESLIDALAEYAS